MLRFQYTADDCFRAVVDSALSSCADDLREWIHEGKPKGLEPEAMEELRDWFDAAQLLTLLERLIEAHRAPQLYGLNDWHYLVLYHVLDIFVAVHNGLVGDTGAIEVGGCLVGEIDFDGIVGIFFWDTDFLTEPDVFDGIPRQLRSSEEFSLEWIAEQGLHRDKVNNLDFSDELFGIVHGMTPHPEELALVPISDDHACEPVGRIFEAGQGYPYSPGE